MNRVILNSSGKFKKRRQLAGEDGEFCIGCVEFEMPVVYPSVGIQKGAGNVEKSGIEVEIWGIINTGLYFSQNI